MQQLSLQGLAGPLPSEEEMYRAVAARDASYEGVFLLGVTTTGICCRPGCPARTPRPENVEYFARLGDALAAGYRPCRRCRPEEPKGEAPEWLAPLLAELGADPSRRWTDQDLRDRSLDPTRVRRWFQNRHGMTFHAYHRSLRLGKALGRIREGGDLLDAGYEAGFESASAFHEAFTRLFGATPGRSRTRASIAVEQVLTPLGPMLAGATDQGLCLLEFTDRRMLEGQIRALTKQLDAGFHPGRNEHTRAVAAQLEEYFAGKRRDFTVPLVLKGTPFQEKVWRALLQIPYGETRSYEEIARAVGSPGATRAVGTANGRNRLAVVVPCHRVIRADGSLSGYGGGRWRKHRLLDLERA